MILNTFKPMRLFLAKLMYYTGWLGNISREGRKLSAQFNDFNCSLKEMAEKLGIFAEL